MGVESQIAVMLAVLVVELVHEAVVVAVAVVVVDVVVSVVEAVVVVVASSVIPEVELPQIGQHLGSQPASGKASTRRAIKRKRLRRLIIFQGSHSNESQC